MNWNTAPKALTAAFAAAACLALSGPALAGDPAPATVKTAKVSAKGLDLATLEGRDMLDRRIERAARQVCDYDAAAQRVPSRYASTRACMVKARASAEKQVAALIEEQRLGG